MASSSSIGQFLRTASLWTRPANASSNAVRTTQSAASPGAASQAAPAQTASTRIFLSLASLQRPAAFGASTSSDSKVSGLLELAKALPSIKASRKNAARERLAQLKTQIEALQRFFIASGPNGSKAMAALLKTLAAELKSIAAELSQSDGGDAGASTVVTLNVASPAGASGSAEAGGDAADAASDGVPDVPVDAAAGETAETGAAAGADAAAADEAAAAAADAASDADSAVAGNVDKAEGEDGNPDEPTAAAQQAAGTAQPESPFGRGSIAMRPVGASHADGASAADRAMLADVAGKLKHLVALVKAQLQGSKNKDLEKAEASLKDVGELISR